MTALINLFNCDVGKKFIKFIFIILILTSFIFVPRNEALANFHAVGWTNALVPGGGRFAMSEYAAGAKEAALEVTTFGIGYGLSPDSSFTLDGTPIDYPAVRPYNFTKTRQQIYCSKYSTVTKKCIQYKNRSISTSSTTINYMPQDATRPLTAALLQEFGLKYHIMNSFLSYRDQYNIEGGDPGQGIDQRSTKEMFKDPFRWEVLSSPWVYIPIILSSAFVVLDYRSQIATPDRELITPLNKRSKAYLAFDQAVVYPFGSAAPEEAFYRGFVQNEFYYLVRSPYFSIPMSSLIFALSHSQEGWPGAFVTGLYQGLMAYKNDGNLAYGNAIHFWGVFALGVEAYLLTVHSLPAQAPPAAFQFSFTY